MKETIIAIIAIPIVIVVGGFAIYAFFGFLSFLFSDPFDWIESAPQTVNQTWEEQKEVCYKSGGIPIRSGWSGLLKTCEAAPQI